jgi:hypothetical protein
MSTIPPENIERRGVPRILVAGIVLCWLVVAFLHLYCFAFSSMDSWCYALPGLMARAPFHLADPFLGTFQNWNRGWGLHWPGGPMLVSLISPFLPRSPAVAVSIYLAFWLAISFAVRALVYRLTSSPWTAFCGMLFVLGDKYCFSITWLERYELLAGTLAIMAILALCGWQNERPGLRSAIIGLAFFALPLLNPVYTGLAGGLPIYLGFRTIVLRQSWKPFCIAVLGYATGWAVFGGYYYFQPWLYAIFHNHAQVNVVLTHATAPPGIHTFLHNLLTNDSPTRVGVLMYFVSFAVCAYLLWGFVKSGRNWRQFLEREDLVIFTALGLIGTVILAQFTANIYYWVNPWPYAAALNCLAAHRFLQRFPARQPLMVGALAVLVLLHASFWAGRSYVWYKNGFVNIRARARDFADSLPRGGRVFIPEVLWDSFAPGDPNVFMNSLPYEAGIPNQKLYAAFITPLIHSGDVLVVDARQGHQPLIDPLQPGWKVIGHCSVTYKAETVHGFEMTAYQKD